MDGSLRSPIDKEKWSRHVTECPRGDNLFRDGDKAEEAATWYLLDNLATRTVGDYRILTNYHMPVRSSGPAQTQEIDLVLINKFGVFLLEIKDRRGKIVAYDDTWLQDGRDMKGNPLISIESKARTFKSHWFSDSPDLDRLYVKGLVVLARGKATFENRSNYEERSIVGIDEALLRAVNPPSFLLRPDHRKLTDEEIEKINKNLFRKHIKTDEALIEDYRLGTQLLPGDLYKAYEAVNQNLPSQRVRIKVYQLKDKARFSEDEQRKIRRDAEAVSKLGLHPNILYTFNFFPHPDDPNFYYEVTELINGTRLDKLLGNRSSSLPFTTQINYLIQLCAALIHAHSQGIFHRNICPETIYVTTAGVVKLGDFDFAKVTGLPTLVVDPKSPLIDKEFTPPELIPDATNASAVSDLYSLGYLWLYMACWPEKERTFKNLKTLPIPAPARDLMMELLSDKPVNRPQSAEILLSKFHKLQEIK